MSATILNYLRPIPGEPKWSLAVTERGVELLRASDRRVLAVWRPTLSRLQIRLSTLLAIVVVVLVVAFGLAVVAGPSIANSTLPKTLFGCSMIVVVLTTSVLRVIAPARRVESVDPLLTSFLIGSNRPLIGRAVRDADANLIGRILWKPLASFRLRPTLRCKINAVSGAKLTLRKLPATSNCFEVTDRRTRAVVAWIGLHPGGATLSLPDQPVSDLDDRILAALLYSMIWIPEDQK
jgi:hypothetical protein